MQKDFLDFELEQSEALVIGTAADPTLHTTQKRARTFLKDDVEREDIIVALEVLSKAFS